MRKLGLLTGIRIHRYQFIAGRTCFVVELTPQPRLWDTPGLLCIGNTITTVHALAEAERLRLASERKRQDNTTPKPDALATSATTKPEPVCIGATR